MHGSQTSERRFSSLLSCMRISESDLPQKESITSSTDACVASSRLQRLTVNHGFAFLRDARHHSDSISLTLEVTARLVRSGLLDGTIGERVTVPPAPSPVIRCGWIVCGISKSVRSCGSSLLIILAATSSWRQQEQQEIIQFGKDPTHSASAHCIVETIAFKRLI